MPGFKVPKTTFRLVFEDEQYDGLEIRAKSLSLREFFELQQQQAKAGEDAEAASNVISRLAEALISWNLEDEDGKPVPANEENLRQQEIGFVMAIMDAWMGAIASVPNRSLPASNAGGTSQELSIPMEVS